MAKKLLVTSTVIVGALTAAGYITIWAYLWPFGLERHIGDVPFASYIGYGISAASESPPILACLVFILGVISLWKLALDRQERGYTDIVVALDKKLGPLTYFLELSATYGNGYCRRIMLPTMQVGLSVITVIGLLICAWHFGWRMVDDAVHGLGSGAATGVTIQRRDFLTVDGKTVAVKGKVVSVWNAPEGTYFTPVLPRRANFHTFQLLFVPREQMRSTLQSRSFAGRCATCVVQKDFSGPWLLGILVFILISFGLAAYRDWAWHGGAESAITTTGFSSIDLSKVPLVYKQHLLEALRREQRIRLVLMNGSTQDIYYIEPGQLDLVSRLQYVRLPAPALLRWIGSSWERIIETLVRRRQVL